MKFLSTKRFEVALVLAALSVIYIFNFVSAYTNVVDSRSLGRQVFDYILNISIFTLVFYLIISFFVYLYSIAFGKK